MPLSANLFSGSVIRNTAGVHRFSVCLRPFPFSTRRVLANFASVTPLIFFFFFNINVAEKGAVANWFFSIAQRGKTYPHCPPFVFQSCVFLSVGRQRGVFVVLCRVGWSKKLRPLVEKRSFFNVLQRFINPPGLLPTALGLFFVLIAFPLRQKFILFPACFVPAPIWSAIVLGPTT